LAEEGALVVISGRRAELVEKAAVLHESITGVVADVSSLEDNTRLIDQTVRITGGLDVLFNNAGIAISGLLADVRLEDYDKVFGVNVRGLLDLTQKALPLLVESKGVIINNASISGLRPGPGGTVYGASKAAVLAFTTSWAKELAAAGVRVVSISPGPIETPIWDKHDISDEELKAAKQRVAEANPQKRFGRAEEVAALVAFIASGEAPYVSGTDIRIDGGQIS
jgi:NAD(P)-dependent dehydrogenase (short-subunit alcohol dehydrogenase family)